MKDSKRHSESTDFCWQIKIILLLTAKQFSLKINLERNAILSAFKIKRNQCFFQSETMLMLLLQLGQTHEELVSPGDPGRQMLTVVGDQLVHFLQTSVSSVQKTPDGWVMYYSLLI